MTPLSSLSEKKLLLKIHKIAGLNLAEISTMLNVPIPDNLNKNKGWIGMLIERYLQVHYRNKAEPDFPELGIELKTVPISNSNTPLETTFVCLAPLDKNIGLTWETSHVRKKLQKVLWLPVQGERQIPLKNRKVGHAILWQPNKRQEDILKNDWEELMEYIILGRAKEISAKFGVALQLRPKASNNKEKTVTISKHGKKILVNPLGFYLRKEFTQKILFDFLHK